MPPSLTHQTASGTFVRKYVVTTPLPCPGGHYRHTDRHNQTPIPEILPLFQRLSPALGLTKETDGLGRHRSLRC